MAQAKLAADSPKVFQALARFLSSEQVAIVAHDYALADMYGGNIEPGLTREEGISFNPRLARIVSILVHDIAVRDLTVIRAAIYAAATDSGLGCLAPERQHHAALEVPAQLKSVVNAESQEPLTSHDSRTIRAVIVLDSVRHLHQGAWSVREREGILANAEQTLHSLDATQAASELILKLKHAIELQRRRLENE
jgi:hypothetical protein